MDPPTTSIDDDAEFSLPPEFLTDDDFLVEKENKNCLFPYESSHGLESDSSFTSTVKQIDDDEEKLLAGLNRKMVLEDDLSGGVFAFQAGENDTKAWCVASGRQNQTAEELELMNINGYNNHNGRGLLDLPRKHPLAAAKIPNGGSGYYNRQPLQHQMLQAIHQQRLMKRHRELVQQSRGGLVANENKKIAASVDLLSPSAWSNQHVFLGNRTGKRGSTGTGVFLPRCVNHATAEVREKPILATVVVPARVVQPSVMSSPSLNDGSWSQRINNGGFSNQMKMEQPVNDPRLPSDWAY